MLFFHFAGRLPSFMLQTKINSINYNRKRKERELKLPLVITKGLHINAALSASNTVIFDDCVTVLLSIFCALLILENLSGESVDPGVV